MNIKTYLKRLHERINGSTIEYDLTQYTSIINEINNLESTLINKTDNQLKKLSHAIKERAQTNTTLDDLLIEAYALVREASKRTIKLRPFDVQIIAGIVMHQGKLVEMQTGEGKTLAAVFPAYLNSLSGKSVHVLTFNDYLTRRDAKWMGPIYNFLGVEVSFIQEGMSISERKKAYSAEITYVTAKKAGFDYLRDSLCYEKENIVHRPFNYAIIDEADSILIDEARVPLVIAGDSDDSITVAHKMAKLVRNLDSNTDFEYDEYARNINLTDIGLKRVEELLNCDNLYAEKNYHLLTHLNCAINAEFLLNRDVDYIVRDNKIELVDEFTGRVADGRRWPDGLQAALEAKENLALQHRGKILNSIALQHFLQLYPKVCGMTATAQSAEEEFKRFYNLHIVIINPNKKCIRIDHQDVIFANKEAKHKALIEEIIRVNQTKRPILVGTKSVEESILIAKSLQETGIGCEILNAKNDEFEAQIISQAGSLGAVTISTNMAGRGTDIRLGGNDGKDYKKVVNLGGLYVIGTNKHESQRIDNQLRGRAGRQGDPGSSLFFISLQDELLEQYKIHELIHLCFSVFHG